MKQLPRRTFLAYGAAAGSVLVLGSCSGGSSGDSGGGGGDDGLPDIQGAELITDRSAFPSGFRERPEFADQVAAGTLPPVAERIGQDPLVLRPVEAVGQYGGTWRRAFLGVQDFNSANRLLAGPDSLLYWDVQRENVVPNLARDFELSDDFTELTLHLRRGMRWSDGRPFTADDILFWRDHMSLDPAVSPSGSPALRAGGEEVTVEKVDDYTVVYRAPAPHPLLPALMASTSDIGGPTSYGKVAGGGYAPAHYLRQFHAAFTSEAEANRLAADAGLASWRELLLQRNTWELNPYLPLLTPWVVTRPINDPPWEFFANPYSVWVDTEGNQLPYIGEITMEQKQDVQGVIASSIAGEYDFQDRSLTVDNLTVLIENQSRSDYTIHRNPNGEMDFVVRLNLAYDDDPVIGELIRTVEFRRALSLGIDRDQVNEAFFLGTSRPSATMVADDSPYFPGPEWRTKWATLDPAQANELLDGIGLTDRDDAGFRLRPDGGGRLRLDYQAVNVFGDYVGMGEMVAQHWRDIGIDMQVQSIDGGLGLERTLANAIQLSGLGGGTDDVFLRADAFLPTVPNQAPGLIGIPYAQWFTSGGATGVEPPRSLRLHEAMDLLAQGLQAPEDERIEIGKEIYKLHADQVWSIGVVGFGLTLYGIYLNKNNVRNVPARVVASNHSRTPLNTFPMTFWIDQG